MINIKYEYKDDPGNYYNLDIKKCNLQTWKNDNNINILNIKEIDKMIKINIEVRDFNKINKFGKKYTSKNDNRIALKYNKWTIEGNNLKVEGLDGYKLFTLNLDIENVNNVDGILYIEPMNNFKIASNTIVVTESDEEIRINDINNNDIRVVKNNKDIEFFNTKDIYEEDDPVFEISFSIKHLRDALQGFETDDIVDLKFFDKHKQVIIDNNLDAKSLVLPVRKPE